MVNWTTAIYFGIGIFISQSLHTLYTQRNSHQKKVPIFEQITWLGDVGERRNIPILKSFPDVSRYIDPHPAEKLEPHNGVSTHPLLRPWKLPHFQRPSPPYQESWKYKTAKLNRLLGLQATNIFYCYVASLLIGVLSIIILRYGLETPASFNRTNVSLIFFLFGALIVISWEFVGSSFAQLAIESTLSLNSIVLITSQVASVGIAVSLLGLGATIAIAGLINWMSEVRKDEEFDRGNLVAGYYALGSFIYAEAIVLGILLTKIG